MLNQTVIVGRLVDTPKMIETENGKECSNITLAVPRSYKNFEGIYETDFVDCCIWGNVAKNTCEYCKKGDMLGVRGRIETTLSEIDGKTQKITKVIGEKVTFLSSAKEKQNDKELY